MTASEVLDFVVESIMRTNVTATHLRPFKFGQNRGFRFDLTYLSAEGLDYEGLVAGSIKDDQLYLVIYTGTKVYYYPKYKDDVEQIISSLEILP
jgi:hypothetical protein